MSSPSLAGLSLQVLAGTLGPGRARQRIQATIGDLDATIAQIRTSIFALQQNPQTPPRGLRARLLDVVTEVTPALGFALGMRFSGLLDGLPDQTAEDLQAVLREALTNIARHAHAHTADVDLTRHPQRLTLDIRDDGTGLGDTTRYSRPAPSARPVAAGALTRDSRVCPALPITGCEPRQPACISRP